MTAADTTSRDINEARKLINNKQFSRAQQLLYPLVAEHPDTAELQYLLGILHLNAGNFPSALDHLAEAHELAPGNVEYHTALGGALRASGMSDRAQEELEKVLARDPNNQLAQLELGALFAELGDWENSIQHLERLVSQKPSHAMAHALLARSLQNTNRYDEAVNRIERAVKLDPGNVAIRHTRAEIRTALGDSEGSRKDIEAALSANPADGVAIHHLALLERHTSAESALAKKARKALKAATTTRDSEHLHFALGKINDDAGNWDDAFEHFRLANALLAPNHDARAMKTFYKSIRKTFAARFFERTGHLGVNSEEPIFIVGMPRSGTTLLDQILTSHPQVTSIGESRGIFLLTRKLASETGAPYPGAALDMDAALAERLGARYLDESRAAAPEEAPRIVDKMPANFENIGLIHALFPRARILHMHRNPLDTCLSNYFTRFHSLRMSWAWNLTDIGRYYREYVGLMAHWEQTLPGRILTVHYEDLVGDNEAQIARVLEHCGLPWDEKCLKFFETRRGVGTASVMQVREKLYNRSINRWHHYARHLQPLVTALGPEVLELSDELASFGLRVPVSARLHRATSFLREHRL